MKIHFLWSQNTTFSGFSRRHPPQNLTALQGNNERARASLAGKSRARRKICTVQKDHLEIGRREEYYDPERLAVIKQTFNRIYSNYLQDGLPESFGLISALQAMIDAGYRAGKRAERARRKVQTAA